MKATITDAHALAGLAPSAMAAYLRAHGWTAKLATDDAYAIFERTEGGEPVGVDVPLRTTARDYARRVAELLGNLELIEHRSQLAIFHDVMHANQDVVRLSVDVPEVGRIALEEASTLLVATRDLVLAAACAAHAPRAYHSPRKPARATEYLRTIRMAAPETGSFVIVLESPVAALAADAMTFERAAVLMLAKIGARVRHAISDATTSGSLDRFATSVEAGVSANYCDALARLLEDEGRAVELGFEWAAAHPQPDAVPSSLRFARSDADVLRAATRYLKERAPLAGYELVGAIVKLQSTTPSAGGDVTIAGLVDNSIRQVTVALSADDYHLAGVAHQQQLEVSVEGELEREGRGYRLRHPRLFAAHG